MTTVAPPPPPGTPPPTPPPTPAVVLPAPPPNLTALPLATLLQATVQPPAQPGMAPSLLIQTAAGPLLIESPWTLPPGGQLTFALEAKTPQTLLRLLTIDGKPAPQTLAPHLPGQTAQRVPNPFAAPAQSTAPPSTPATPGAVVVGRGDALLATMLRAAPGPTPAPQAPAGGGPAPPPSPFPNAATTPAGRPAGVPGAPPSMTSPHLPAGQSAPASATARPAFAAPEPPATGPRPAIGQQLQVRLLAAAPPGTSQTQPAPAIGAAITGTVSGATPGGQPVIDTPLGQLAVWTRTALPPGTRVHLDVLDLVEAKRPPTGGPKAPPPLDPLGRDWPALRDAVDTLRQIDPGLYQRVLDSALPRPTSTLGSRLLFFMSALRGGDLGTWLGGDAGRALAARKPDTLDRLGEDFKTLGRASNAPQGGDWRLYGLPLFDGQDIAQMRLMVRDRPSGETEDPGRQAETRFIVDVDLSRMGRLQIDGLVRGGERRFDLILRTAEPLPPTVRDDIRAIFRDSCEITGYRGGLRFQVGTTFVDPPPSARQGAGEGTFGLDA